MQRLRLARECRTLRTAISSAIAVLVCLCSARAPVGAVAGSRAAGFGDIAATGSRALDAAAEVAVVVNAKSPVDNLSMGQLRSIMLGDRQFWSPGDRVTLLIRAQACRERDVLLKRVYQMSETQFRQYWIAKVFRAEAPSAPKVVNTDESAVELTAGIPGAIAFVDASTPLKGVKVIKVDGRKPGDKGYPLT